jgi:hypothetical protein
MDNLPIRLLENLQILIEEGMPIEVLSRAISKAIVELKEKATDRQELPRHPQSSK